MILSGNVENYSMAVARFDRLAVDVLQYRRALNARKVGGLASRLEGCFIGAGGT